MDTPEPLRETGRPSYSALLARVFPQDFGACTHCGGELRFIACIDDPKTIAKILRHLGLPVDPPKAAPARDPPQLTFESHCDVDFDQTEGALS